MSNFQTTPRWRLRVRPPAPDPRPDEIPGLEAVFTTQTDAEAAADLVRRIYRGQGFQTEIEEIPG